jgi:hypothetical protein
MEQGTQRRPGGSRMAKPKVGDKIYVEGTIYVTHGADDFQGGVCTVKAVQSHVENSEEVVSSVEIEEDPGTWYTWAGVLESRQEALKERYGEQKAGPKPDYRAEFNDEYGGWEPLGGGKK